MVIIDTDLIHRVEFTKPKTLSMNVVSDQAVDENAYSSYNVYITPHAELGNIKTEREIVPFDISKMFVKEIIQELEAIV